MIDTDTPNKLQREEVVYQQTYDYTWEANLEQKLNSIKEMLITLQGNGETECPAELRASIIGVISQMRFFLQKYNRDTKEYEESLLILNESTDIGIYDAIFDDMQSNFANEAGYILNFRAKTDRREDWENF